MHAQGASRCRSASRCCLLAAVLWQASPHRLWEAVTARSRPGWFFAALVREPARGARDGLALALLLVARGRHEPGFGWLTRDDSRRAAARPGAADRRRRRRGAGDRPVPAHRSTRRGDLVRAGRQDRRDGRAGRARRGRSRRGRRRHRRHDGARDRARGRPRLRPQPRDPVLSPGSAAFCARSCRSPGGCGSRAPARALYDALHAYRGIRARWPGSSSWPASPSSCASSSSRCWRTGWASTISFGTLLLLCPVLFLVTVVPVSLNGIGLREATFVVVLARGRGRARGRVRARAGVLRVGVLTALLGGVVLVRRSLAGRHENLVPSDRSPTL